MTGGIDRPRRARAGGRLSLLLALLLAGAPAGADTLVVSAAVSLKPALSESARLFEQARPETEILLNTGGSGVLLQQALRGSPVDVFVSASPDEIDRLTRSGRVLSGSTRTLASNRLVIVVPAGTTPPASTAGLAELGRVAVGNPRTAPLGRYTEQALRATGLWQALGDQLVFAENARQVLDYVARRAVSAGVVYRSDASLLPGRIAQGPTLPGKAHRPVAYVATVLSATASPRAAGEFVELLASTRGRAIFARHGFVPVPASDP